MAPVLLGDGHAYAYRAFHAIRGLKSADGRPTGAIFGFVKMVGRLTSLTRPGHMAVVWDGGLSPERADLMPEYKAQRPPMPDDLDRQIKELMAYLPDAGIASVQQDEVEADDLIATIATSAAARTGARLLRGPIHVSPSETPVAPPNPAATTTCTPGHRRRSSRPMRRARFTRDPPPSAITTRPREGMRSVWPTAGSTTMNFGPTRLRLAPRTAPVAARLPSTARSVV